ncbi:MAG: hypothetical protein Alis3KO_40440 [Aliiglaciecola sp.]
MTKSTKCTKVELTEIEGSDLNIVFGGHAEYETPEHYTEIQDYNRTIPSDPSRRKKKRLSMNDE